MQGVEQDGVCCRPPPLAPCCPLESSQWLVRLAQAASSFLCCGILKSDSKTDGIPGQG